MKIVNGWQIPQAGDKYNSDWAGNIENTMTSYAQTVDRATGKIILSAGQYYADFYKAVNVAGVEYIVYDPSNATMGVANLAPLSSASDIGSLTSAFDSAYINDIYTLSAGVMVKVSDYLSSNSGGAISAVGNLTSSPSNVITVVGGLGSVIGTGTTINLVKADSVVIS